LTHRRPGADPGFLQERHFAEDGGDANFGQLDGLAIFGAFDAHPAIGDEIEGIVNLVLFQNHIILHQLEPLAETEQVVPID
jgi:hypothetical protein